MSPFHFHRVFKAVTGLTPKGYAAAHRSRKVRERLADGGTITEALYDAGFNPNSRFYEAADKVLGMKPADYRAAGQNTDIRFAVGQCSLGAILVAQSERGVCAILLGDDPDALVRDLQDKFRRANLIGADREFEQLIAQVVGFIEAPALGLDLPLDLRCTAFQERVWQALRDIPAGSTASYAEIAQRIGMPKAVRAVAQACGANSLAVAILATGWCAATATCRAIAGGWSASVSCWNWSARPGTERRCRSPRIRGRCRPRNRW